MDILFVTQGFPSEKNPMAGNYEAVQAHAVASFGHNVSVVYFRWVSLIHVIDRKYFLYRKSANIDVYEMVGIILRLPYLSKFLKNYKLDRWMMQQAVKRFAKKYKKRSPIPDIIHIHSQFVAKYAIVLKKELNVPVVLTEHWSGLNTGFISKNLLSERKVYLLSDAVIVVSRALQKALRNFYRVESEIIPNMVDNRFFKDERQAKYNDTFIFISVGRLVPIKCFDSLIMAVSLMEQNSKMKLIIIGEGPDHNKLEKKVENLQLKEKVQLVGLKTPDEVSGMLCNSDCFVLSSHRETFGIALIEAMAIGLPVISTKCGGPEDFVNTSNGILVEPDNPTELAKAMDFMVLHAHEYDGVKIKHFCFDNFSQDKVANQIIHVYENVLHNN